MEDNLAIGGKVKELRTKNKMTLKQLSEATGLSTGFLSQLERGISTIAIDSLSKIAQALNVELHSFFVPKSRLQADPVMRSHELEYKRMGNHIVESILSHDVDRFEMLSRVFQVMPNASSDKPPAMIYSHNGEEMIYVLEGVLTVYLNGSEHTLYPGDSIQIHSTNDHNWENRTNQIVRFIQVNYPNPYKDDDE